MSRSRHLPAVGLLVALAIALVILMVATPVGAQLSIGWSDPLATPIPLPGVQAADADLPTPRAIYIADDPSQVPPVTPMP
ncbi:MAG: hypothetical protein KatS3mg053_0005 [Candidatus Roseilinea sp.]|nr:MAG: hypothetical protein KatS3mg053_0005 [Candidatus Roseilinea sp.]